jgi:cold shock protein
MAVQHRGTKWTPEENRRLLDLIKADFIADDAGGPDVFLHISALQSAGIDPDNIRKGDRLTFDVESTREGMTRAANVRRPG